MLIRHTFKGMLTNETKDVLTDDMVSPSDGYTQSYADKAGEDYPTERLGDSDYWEHQSSEYVK